VSVLLEMCEWTLRRVDRQLGKVGAAQPFELRIEVREITALQEGVVTEIDAGHNVLRAEGDLFGLGEEIVDTPIKH